MSLARQAFRRILGQRLPLTDGVLTVDGVTAPVTIVRDRWHVPHIAAETVDDGWYGLGFCQGQDRAFQLELRTRVATGRVAAFIGRDGIPIDRLVRRLGLARRAEQQLRRLDPDVRSALTAFARGLTDGASLGSPRPAHEFTLLRCRPTPIGPVHVAALVKLQGFLLAANWQTELARLHVLVHDGPEALADLDATYAAHLPVSSPPAHGAGPALDALARDLAALGDAVPVGGGSNNWVLAGSRTASGRPLVANDPHLPPGLPPHWYLAHLTTPQWQVAGAVMIGTPAFVVAHNDTAAWGVTSAHTDDTDLFLEELDPAHRRCRDADGWADCEVRVETIEVRGADDETIEIVETPRGPVVGDTLGAPVALSMRGMWLEDGPVEGFLTLPEATTFDDARRRFAAWPGMTLNLVWGDVEGHIGWQLVGELPIRRAGLGTVPLAGWDPGVGWDGRVPFEQMPSELDPALGLIATANNKPRPDTDGPWLGADFLAGYRNAAVIDVLTSRDAWDVPSTLAAQLDTRSLPWLACREALLGADTTDPDAAIGSALLAAWDGTVTADSPAAAVFELTLAELTRRTVQARAPRSAAVLLGASPWPEVLDHTLPALQRLGRTLALLEERPDGWFADGWQVAIGAAIAAAVHTLRDRAGDDTRDWAWGSVRPLVLRSVVSGTATALAPVFDRGPVPLGGDAETIPQASPPPLDPLGDPIAIASARAVMPVGDWSDCRWVLPGGQSGDPVSPHYDDQLPLWLAGDGIPIAWGAEEVADAKISSLRLVPTAGPAPPRR